MKIAITPINNSLKSADLKDGAAVRGVDVINNSLTGADIDESTLSASLARGSHVRILANRLVLQDEALGTLLGF